MASGNDFAPLSDVCARALSDKMPDKRKAAATEIEKMVKECLVNNNVEQLLRIIKILSKDFTLSANPNSRKGGMLGLASVAVALGKDTTLYMNYFIQPILSNFTHTDSTVKFHAAESMYNVIKLARGSILPQLPEIFSNLERLATDPDLRVCKGAEHLDRLLKEVITEEPQFKVEYLIPILRERIYSTNFESNEFILSWILAVNDIPDMDMIPFLPDLLDGLFFTLKNTTSDVKKSCETILNSLSREIIEKPEKVNLGDTINTIAKYAQDSYYLVKGHALQWLSIFLKIKGPESLQFASTIIFTCLTSLSCEGENKEEIIKSAKELNKDLMNIFAAKAAKNANLGIDDDIIELVSVVTVILKELKNPSNSTKLAAIEWINHLHQHIPNKVMEYINNIFPELLEVLSDNSEEVVYNAVQVSGTMIAPNKKDQDVGYFNKFIVHLLRLFQNNNVLLDDKGSGIIRQLCCLIDPELIFIEIAKFMTTVSFTRFHSVMIDTINTLLLTTPELINLRNKLKCENCNELFNTLYMAWCYNSVATISLCLLSQNYHHVIEIIRIMTLYEITIEILADLDKLIQLIESPIFTTLRLQLIDNNAYLYTALFSLLMILPQSESFHLLRQRLKCIPHSKDQNIIADMSDQTCGNRLYDLNYNKLKERFIEVKEYEKSYKLAAMNIKSDSDIPLTS